MSIERQRADYLFLAKVAEQAERYDEMVDNIKKIAGLNVQLTEDERDTLSVGFKNVLGPKRAARLKISSIEQNDEMIPNETYAELTREYRLKIEQELSDVCHDLLSIIEENLLPNAAEAEVEAKVLYHKLKGDYYRYLCEFKVDVEKTEAIGNSKASYEEATILATNTLAATNPVRLGLAINYSVLHYEILHSVEDAIRVAKKAFNDAISMAPQMDEETSVSSNMVLEMLTDNLNRWNNERRYD